MKHFNTYYAIFLRNKFINENYDPDENLEKYYIMGLNNQFETQQECINYMDKNPNLFTEGEYIPLLIIEKK